MCRILLTRFRQSRATKFGGGRKGGRNQQFDHSEQRQVPEEHAGSSSNKTSKKAKSKGKSVPNANPKPTNSNTKNNKNSQTQNITPKKANVRSMQNIYNM